MAEYRVLVIDDEPDLRTLYELTLVREAYRVEVAATVKEAFDCLAQSEFDAVITDMRLPDGSGLDIIRHLDTQARNEKVIVITAYGSAQNAVEALKAGAYDYLTKPVDLKQFRTVVASTLRAPAELAKPERGSNGRPASTSQAQAPDLTDPLVQADARLRSPTLARMVGDSAPMRSVRSLIEKVSKSMAPVLISGESGTGKELAARSIHELSGRSSGPFVAVNCGAIPESLLEAEFFGYRKGAFTGAQEDRHGFFQAAEGGTLFLDEIGDLPLSMQSKLLRAIQERSVRPVGSTQESAVNVRLLSATHKDLDVEVDANRFRRDLFYRLNVIPVYLPSLRERMSDLPAIASSVLARLAREANVSPSYLGEDALQQLQKLSFPGNVRELENMLHRAVAMADDEQIDGEDLGLAGDAERTASEVPCVKSESTQGMAKAQPTLDAAASREQTQAALPRSLSQHLDEVEREILNRALWVFGNNRTAAGAWMGLSLRQMRYRMARLNIQVGGDGDSDTVSGGTSEL